MDSTFKQQYNYTFGILTAMAIIFVVAGHLNYNLFTLEGLFPYYSYHMPLFIFISGYFYKEEYENHVRMFLWKKIKRLVIPYFIWNIFYGILVLILKRFGFTIGNEMNLYTVFVQPFIDGHQFYFNLAAWFLLALFIIEVLYLFEQKLVRCLLKNKLAVISITFVISLVFGIVAIQISNKGYNDSFWLIIVRTLFFFPFYGLGNIYKTVLEEKDTLNNYLYFTLTAGGQFLIMMHYGWIPTFSAAFGQFFWNPVMQYLTAFLGIAFWLRIAKIITPIVKQDGLFIYLGKNSFSVMMHHLGITYCLMLFLTFISRFTPYFQDIDINVIKTVSGSWYCPNGNSSFLLFYLTATIALLILLCKIKDKVIIFCHQKFRKEDKNEGKDCRFDSML